MAIKSFSYAEVSGAAHTITFVSDHNLGGVGELANLTFASLTGTPPAGMVSGVVYKFTVTTARILTLADITDRGSIDFTGTLSRESFTPNQAHDVDIPVMVGGNTAIFYAKWDPNLNEDDTYVRQCPEFHCRSGFASVTASVADPLPPGVTLTVNMSGDKIATLVVTASQLAAIDSPPVRTTVLVTCETKGITGSEVKPTFWGVTRTSDVIPVEDRSLPYEEYWTTSTRQFTVELVVHTHDEAWLERNLDDPSTPNELKIVCEVGRYIAIDFNPMTTLDWDPSIIYDWFGIPIVQPLSIIDAFGGAKDDSLVDRRHGVWCNYTIFMLDEHGQLDLANQSGLFCKFPGHGDDDYSANCGLQAQGPITIHGTPTQAGNTSVEVFLKFDASLAHKYAQGWWQGPEMRIVINITILDKLMAPGRAVVLHKLDTHGEDRFWVSSNSSTVLNGSWQSSLTPENPPDPGGGYPKPPVPPVDPYPPAVIVGPVPPDDPTTPPPIPDWSENEPEDPEETGSSATYEPSAISMIMTVPGTDDTYVHVYGPGPGAGTEPSTEPDSANDPLNYSVIVPFVDILAIAPWPTTYPLAIAAYTVSRPQVDQYINWPPAGSSILSAFGWQYAYNPANEVIVPTVDYLITGTLPTEKPLATAPYTVTTGSIDRVINWPPVESSIVSAFGWESAYNPADDVNVPDVVSTDHDITGISAAP